MRALVTGAGGFVGQYLCRALLREGWSVAATTVGTLPEPGTLSANELSAIHWRNIDLRVGASERRSISALLASQPPDAIYHLAGVSFQPNAAADVAFALGTNVGGLVNLIEGVRLYQRDGQIDPVVLVVGSGEQYGRHEPSTMPLSESAEQRPVTFYATTKQAQEAFALTAFRGAGIRMICTRSFNHSGRGQAPHFLLPALVARAKASQRSGEPVRIGNTDVIRDFMHVEDVVRAYISLVSRGQPGEVYNVCSGEGVRVGDLAQEVLEAAGVRAPLEVDPTLQRAVDVPALVGSNAKLRAATGWSPLKSRTDIISDLLEAAS